MRAGRARANATIHPPGPRLDHGRQSQPCQRSCLRRNDSYALWQAPAGFAPWKRDYRLCYNPGVVSAHAGLTLGAEVPLNGWHELPVMGG